MWPRSARFDNAIKGLQRARYVTQIDAYRAGTLKRAGIPFVAGNITLDITAASRRALQLEVVDEDGTLTPKLPTDALAARGSELYVRCGFDYLDGSAPELVPMGWFRIIRSVPTSGRQISITGADRSEPITAAGFEVPYAISAGTNTGDAIRTLIASRLAGLAYNFAGTTGTLPLTVYQEGTGTDPWRAATDLAQSDGKELYFDPTGAVVLRARPDPSAVAPVWTYAPGSDSIRLGAAADQVLEDVRNVWVVSGEGSGTAGAIRASTEITDATSPIHPGVIGRRPRFTSTPLARSAYTANLVATQQKALESGVAEQVTFSAIPHPAHEPGDVVRVQDSNLGLDAIVVLAGWSFDLRFGQAATFTTLGRRFT